MENENKEYILRVYGALQEKGYNAVGQIVGYLLTEDPTYIIEAHSVRIAELMKNHEHGILTTTTDKLLVDFATEVTKRVNSDYLKKEYPSVYTEALRSSKSRKIKVTIQPV